MVLKLKMDQMRGDNRQLGKYMFKLLGDTVVALVVGGLSLFILGSVLSAIWSLLT